MAVDCRYVSTSANMQKSFSNRIDREELLARLARLAPVATPRWGTMTAHRMLAHLVDWMLMAKGDLAIARKSTVLQYPPLKQLAIYWLPFPRGVPTAPELISRKPLDWAIECAAMREHMQWFEHRDPNAPWPEHPI